MKRRFVNDHDVPAPPPTAPISRDDIAIIGMAFRLGDCTTTASLWNKLMAGTDFVSAMPDARRADIQRAAQALGLDANRFTFQELAYLPAVDTFDPSFFRLSPAEAAWIDPAQRMFLEVAYSALEDAGYGGIALKGSDTGIFVGLSQSRVKLDALAPADDANTATRAFLGNLPSMMASRIAYLLDLHGPALCVDTACSSSLVAMHLAVQAMRRGECSTALVGGAKIELFPAASSVLSQILSSTARTRTFDDSSDGTGGGEGVIVFLLKPLQRAQQDGDHIHAIIKGSAVNQDGSSIGITAPNAKAQAEVICRAWEDARIQPETISYVEAHGTGTRLGDPVEIEGLTRAFRRYTDKRQFCAVGSIKSNMGHLDTAAGAVGVLKCVLGLIHKQLPPLVHFQTPNNQIAFEDSPIYIQDQLCSWQPNGERLRCGVSSFGLSGTNCHVVLEESPGSVSTHSEPTRDLLFVLSARSQSALDELIDAFHGRLSHQPPRLEDVCFTAAIGRGHHSHRVAVVANSVEELSNQLGKLRNGTAGETDAFRGHVRVVSSPTTAEPDEITQEQKTRLDQQCADVVQRYRAKPSVQDLRELGRLYVHGADPDWHEVFHGGEGHRVPLPTYAFERQRCWPELAARSSVKESGSHPSGFARSVGGSLIDRCLARSATQDVYVTDFSPEAHWIIREHRVAGRYILVGMAYVDVIAQLARHYFPNTPVSIEDLVLRTPLDVKEHKEVQWVVKKTPNAMHWQALTESEDGEWTVHAEARFGPSHAAIPAMDVEQLRQRCSQNVEQVPSQGKGLVEAGEQWHTLQSVQVGSDCALARLQLPDRFATQREQHQLYPPLLDASISFPLATLSRPHLPATIGRISIHGTTPANVLSYVQRSAHYTETAPCFDVTLMDPQGAVFAQLYQVTFRPADSQTDVAPRSLYRREWIPVAANPSTRTWTGKTVLVLTRGNGVADALCTRLRSSGARVVMAQLADAFAQIEPDRFQVGSSEADYRSLLTNVGEVHAVIHLGLVGHGAVVEPMQDLQFGTLSAFWLTKALVAEMRTGVQIIMVAEHAHHVVPGDATPSPGACALFGLSKVIPQEVPGVTCRCLDVDRGFDVSVLATALLQDASTFVTALRKGLTYAEQFEVVSLPELSPSGVKIQPGSIYLITGGLGGIGIELGRYLASQGPIQLVLLDRVMLFDRSQWQDIIQSKERLGSRLAAIQEMERNGTRVTCQSVDITDADALGTVINQIRQEHGRIAGVIHAAGIAGNGFIANKSVTDFESTMAPKTVGTVLLDRLTRQDRPDFFFLCSAMSALTGTPGQSDYVAANAFLDGYAASRSAAGLFTQSVHWPAWKETGMAVDHGVQTDGLFLGLSNAEGAAAFSAMLDKNIVEACVGRPNLSLLSSMRDTLPMLVGPRLQSRLKGSTDKQSDAAQTSRRAPVQLQGKSSGEYSDLETRVGQVWADVLGFGQLDIHASIYELGGDSISAVSIVNRINESMGLTESVGTVFAHQTVKAYAAYLQGKQGSTTQPTLGTAIARAAPSERYPLSAAQRRLYILHRFNASSINYNLPDVRRMQGPLDAPRLEEAFRALIQRHDVLRSSFHLEEGAVFARVHEHVDFSIQRTSLREDEIDAAVQSFIRPFDLASAPLLRVALLSISPEQHVLLFDIHHIIADAVSIEVLLREVVALYAGQNLPALPVQYQDYAVWQDATLHGGSLDKHKEYWVQQFADGVPVLSIPLDFSRPFVQSFEGDVVALSIPEHQANELRAFAQTHQVTLYSLMLGALSVTLHKYTGQNDIVIGSTSLGRERAELEGLIGLFINLLPVRTRPNPDLRLRDFMVQCRNRALQAFEHQAYPFDELVEHLQVPRDLGRNPLTDINFSFMSPRHVQAEAQDIKVMPYEGARRYASKADITLFCTDQTDLLLAFEYCSKLFKRSTIQRFAQHLVNVALAMARTPDVTIGDLQVSSAEELETLLRTFNATDRSIPDHTLVELFDKQAERTPDAVAITCGTERMTYAQLREWTHVVAARVTAALSSGGGGSTEHILEPTHPTAAGTGPPATVNLTERLAPNHPADEPSSNVEDSTAIVPSSHALRSGGAGRSGAVVGVLVERRIEMVASLLAVLRAGAAYVPLDPRHPAERLELMLQDCGAQLLLATLNTATHVAFPGTTLLIDGPASEGTGDTQPAIPTALAYLIYTSGTTGMPKGVEVTQRGLTNFVYAMHERIGLQAGSSILALTAVSFDIFVLEALAPLAYGMNVVLLTDEEAMNPTTIRHTLINQHIATVQVTPSRLQMLLEVDPQLSCLQNVSTLLVGGEPFPDHLLHRVQTVYRGRLFNMYGPTETTVWSTTKDLSNAKHITVGTPIANTRVYILDERNHPVPLGVYGELCIAGDGVASGYHGQAEETARKFLPNPFRAGDRMYRTGDVARWLDDGDIQVLGRNDFQVKVRGFRVELGEIETELLAQPDITRCVVVDRKDDKGMVELCAYVVANGPMDPVKVRARLSGRLPDYMIPAYVIKLDTIPVTVHGKVDRARLPAPGRDALGLTHSFVAPQSPIEIKIAQAWCKILQLDRVGVADNFFDVGGNSLRIVQLATELQQALAREVSVLDLFTHPTVQAFAAHVRAQDVAQDAPTPDQDREEKLQGGLARLKRRRDKLTTE